MFIRVRRSIEHAIYACTAVFLVLWLMLRILGYIPLNFFLILAKLFTQRRFKDHFGWYFIGVFYLIALYFLDIYKFILHLYRST